VSGRPGDDIVVATGLTDDQRNMVAANIRRAGGGMIRAVAEWRRKAKVYDRLALIVDEADFYYRDHALTRDEAVGFLIRIATEFPDPEAPQ